MRNALADAVFASRNLDTFTSLLTSDLPHWTVQEQKVQVVQVSFLSSAGRYITKTH